MLPPLWNFLTVLIALQNVYGWYEDFLDEDRIAREVKSSTQSSTNKTENPFAGRNNESDFSWLDDALRDIAYYLRQHKFNEYDRRYYTHPDKAPRNYFAEFPRPPLRSLHWEVRKFCEPSFLMCVEYLIRKIKRTGLKRADDTTIVIQEQQWVYSKHFQQIDAVEKECRKMLETDNAVADPFEGPIERFQWRTTASYYMCWYTIKGVSDLKHLKEVSCDNYASCLDDEYGPHNYDPRAYDKFPFMCAFHSFCPSPCCPLRHIKNWDECHDSPSNPCFAESPPNKRVCMINTSDNDDFNGIILNQWNVSCTCPQKGYEFDPKYGFCVDVNECLGNSHGCDKEREACVNLPGSFRCACRWGYVWDAPRNVCMPSAALEIIMAHDVKPSTVKPERMASSLVKKVLNKVEKLMKSGCDNRKAESLLFAFLYRTLITVYIEHR